MPTVLFKDRFIFVAASSSSGSSSSSASSSLVVVWVSTSRLGVAVALGWRLVFLLFLRSARALVGGRWRLLLWLSRSSWLRLASPVVHVFQEEVSRHLFVLSTGEIGLRRRVFIEPETHKLQ